MSDMFAVGSPLREHPIQKVESSSGADLFIDTARLLNAQEWQWSQDQVHLRRAGYAALGKALAGAMLDFLRTSDAVPR